MRSACSALLTGLAYLVIMKFDIVRLGGVVHLWTTCAGNFALDILHADSLRHDSPSDSVSSSSSAKQCNAFELLKAVLKPEHGQQCEPAAVIGIPQEPRGQSGIVIEFQPTIEGELLQTAKSCTFFSAIRAKAFSKSEKAIFWAPLALACNMQASRVQPQY